MTSLIDRLASVDRWQDISTAPKDGTLILLFGGTYIMETNEVNAPLEERSRTNKY